jgi:transposase
LLVSATAVFVLAATEAAAAAATKDKQDDDDAPTVITTKIKHIIDSILPLRAGLLELLFSLITRSKLIRAFLRKRFSAEKNFLG